MRIQTSTIGNVGLALLSTVIATAPLLAADNATSVQSQNGSAHAHAAPARLIQIVRDATRPFLDVEVAEDAEYKPFLGCISGPDTGAMGTHYVNDPLVRDGVLDASRPEALMYESSKGRLHLLGVEYIVDAATWLADNDGPPVLEGQSFHFVDSPNRYGLAAFFELHVWAWRENPNGAFVDWNTRVNCEGQ